MKEFIKRSISGFFFVLIILVAIWAHEFSFYALLLIILVFSLNEFYKLLYKLKFHPYKLFGILAAILSFTLNSLVAFNFIDAHFMYVNLLIISSLPIVPLLYHPANFTQSWASTLLGWIYILIPLSSFIFLSRMGGSYLPQLVMGIFVIIWANDSFAYITGSLLGKHKMFPEISPKKSWEGFAGGLLLSMGMSLILSRFFNALSSSEWLYLTILIVLTGTLGDFIESAIKRNAGVKDSGKMMPGHGGFLDRFDSLLFALPFVYLYILYIFK